MQRSQPHSLCFFHVAAVSNGKASTSEDTRSVNPEDGMYCKVFRVVTIYACVHDIVALLSITDLREMIDLTWDYRAKWMFIGIELGIDASTLDAIKANHRNVEECLTDMINRWLRSDKPRPTRAAISAALQSGRVLGSTGSCLISMCLVC